MKVFWLLGTAIPALAMVAAIAVPMPVKLIYNGSKSAPLGFYWVDQQAASRQEFVLVYVPKRVRELIEKRKYLPAGTPLIKRVVGIAGDTVCRRGRTILINGVAVSIANMNDNKGRALPNWQGCHVLNAGEVFLLQDHPQSFDGRYFGPIKRSLIIGRAIRLQFPW